MDRSIAHNLLKRFKDKKSQFVREVRSWYNRRKIVSKSKNLKAWLSSEGVEYKPYIKYYGAYLFIYGALLNYTLHILLSFPLTVESVPAWGITYYFLKEELTEVIHTTFRRSRGLE